MYSLFSHAIIIETKAYILSYLWLNSKQKSEFSQVDYWNSWHGIRLYDGRRQLKIK